MTDQFSRQHDHEDEEALFAQSQEQAQPEADTTPQTDSVSRLAPSEAEAEAVEDMQERLSLVDHMLRAAPWVLPSSDFAERVLEAIRQRNPNTFDRYSALGIVIGFTAATSVVLAVLGGLLLGIAVVIWNWTTVYQALVSLAGIFTTLATLTSDELFSYVVDNPWIAALTLLAIPFALVWYQLLRRFGQSGALS